MLLSILTLQMKLSNVPVNVVYIMLALWTCNVFVFVSSANGNKILTTRGDERASEVADEHVLTLHFHQF